MFERVASATTMNPALERRLRVQRDGVAEVKRGKYYRMMFPWCTHHLVPFQGDLDTLVHAVMERGLYVKSPGGFSPRPEPQPGATFAPVLEAYRAVLRADRRLTAGEFLASRPSRLRRIYSLAANRNQNEVFDIDKEATVKGFVKVEKTRQAAGSYFQQDECAKKPVPRLISPRSPRFNCELGPYTIACEHKSYAVFAELFGMPCIMKGRNMTQRAQVLRAMWDAFEDPVFIGADASRFDQHTGVLPLKFDHDVIMSHFPEDRHLAWLLSKQLSNRLRSYTTDGRLTANLGAMRMSGDMNTALGNCVISAGMIWMRLKELGIKAYAVVDGDDNGVICERKDADAYRRGAHEWFLRYGYNMVMEDTVDVFERIIFCQTQPVCVDGDWRMVRDPRKAINSDLSGYAKCNKPDYFRRLIYEVGSAGLCLASGVPVLQSFYLMAMANGVKPLKKGRLVEMQLHGWHHMARLEGMKVATHVMPSTRWSFYRAFGIAPAEQLALEQVMATTTIRWDYTQAPGDYNSQQLYAELLCNIPLEDTFIPDNIA